ncbi:hypothetical protein [Pseudophaeobacter flagellatus]|uniref:hypothetical protein n=1 Tax=Pseudophaeobacter flagellatus TaxID=2899119 RepID=UPI001E5E3C1D|nr:hypothetical protein [Pseudophaeobacter flagellatus]
MGISGEATLGQEYGARFSVPPFGGASGASRLQQAQAFASAMPLVLRFEANWCARGALLRGLGVAMVVGACGLWLFPGNVADPELSLLKIGAAVVVLVLGVVLMTVQDMRNQPEACFDPLHKELRILRRDTRGRPKTVLRRSYDSLGGARLSAGAVQLYERDGSLLVELPLGSAAARSQLRDQLSGAVQLFS